MIISINGPAGSGKSTVAKKLAEKLGWPRYYIGSLRRKKAKELGMSLNEYNKLGEKDPRTDREVDEYQKQLGRKKDNFIIEGRTSWHFIPHSLKIYLDVNEKTGAERIYKELRKDNKRNEGVLPNSVEDVLKSIRERKRSDIDRYAKYYNIDVYNSKHYDYVLDTTDLSETQVFSKVYDFIVKNLGKNS